MLRFNSVRAMARRPWCSTLKNWLRMRTRFLMRWCFINHSSGCSTTWRAAAASTWKITSTCTWCRSPRTTRTSKDQFEGPIMLALQIAEVGKLGLVNADKPEVRPHTLLLRVAASGICGTDPHILHGLYPANLPLIPGHEYAGVVESVGDGVAAFVPGDHVAVDPNILCGVCDFCRRGKVHLCKNLVALGVNIPGGFAEFCVVPVSQAFKIPKSLPLAHAALAEPVACCLRGVDLAGITSGDRVVIFGAGPMGAIILQLARMQGASQVIVIDPQEGRRRRAEALGASWVIDPTKQPVIAAIRSQYPD